MRTVDAMEATRKKLDDLIPRKAGLPDGFRGQHLVVLPAPVRREAGRHPLLRGLLVTDAGVFPRASGHGVRREQGAPTTLVILCLSGNGWAEIDGARHSLGAGDVLWIPAGAPHAYGADVEHPWTIEWAHFTGTETDAWRELLQIPPQGGLLCLEPSRDDAAQLGPVWEALESGYATVNLAAASTALRTFFNRLSLPRPSAPAEGGSPAGRIAASILWIQSHLIQPLRLDELARRAGLSVPHYCVLFKRQTGFAPIDWLIRRRIQRACQLLDTTDENIAAIGRRVGFADPYYFTRCFRRIVGHPPRDYRRVPKG